MTEGRGRIIVVSRYDPAREDDREFVNYNPSNLLNRQHRKSVHAFVSGFHKRKSKQAKPGQVRHVEASKAVTKTSGRPPAQLVHTSLVRQKGRGLPHGDFGYHLGGLRTDPFNSYPVQARNAVTQAVDVYCQIWAPTHVGEYAPGRESNLLLSELFPLALQHVGLFEALVAWSQCFSATYYKQDNFMTKEVFYHRGNAISELRTSLIPSSKVSYDAAILTLCFLMAVEYVTGDVATFETLLQGIYQLVTNAGGLEMLGLKGLTKGMIVRIEKEWTRRRNQKSRYTEIKPTECLEYPIHPFRPDLCESIAKMPKGFRDLALEGVLSIQMLPILERMSEWHTRTEHVHQHVATPEEISLLQAHEPQIEAEEAYRCLEILMSSGVGGGIERCLFMGLIAYSLEVFAQTKFNAELYWAVQDLTMALEVIEPEPIDGECLIWLSMVAVSTCKGSLSQKGSEMVHKVLRDHPLLKKWDQMEEMLRKFFWFDSLAAEWKRRWSAAVVG